MTPDRMEAKIHEQNTEIYKHAQEIVRLTNALRNLVKECPTSVSCDDFSHNRKSDLHGTEEDCPPCCRYYKALHEASELLK